jgi:hypothetical protein
MTLVRLSAKCARSSCSKNKTDYIAQLYIHKFLCSRSPCCVLLTDCVHDTSSAVHDGELCVLDGAAGSVSCVPNGLLGVHGVVCFSVPVPAQDMGAMMWTPIAATRSPLCFLRSGQSVHGVCMVRLVCLVRLVVISVPSQATRLSIHTVCTHCGSSGVASPILRTVISSAHRHLPMAGWNFFYKNNAISNIMVICWEKFDSAVNSIINAALEDSAVNQTPLPEVVIFTQWRDGPLVQGQKGARMRISTNYEINLRDMQLRRSDCKTVTAVKGFWSNDDQLEFNFQEELDRRANAPADDGAWKSKPWKSAAALAAAAPLYNDCSVKARTQYDLLLMRVQRQEHQAAQAAARAKGTAAAEKFLSECEEPGVKKARRD